jgi:predicted phosphohydrolase
MENKSYTTTIVVNKTPKEAFDAITNVRGWWSENVEGGTAKLNDEFDYHYKDIHRCKIRLVEVIPGQKMVWLVLENYFNFITDQTEWVGTKVIFEITEKGDQTEVVFTHEGLVPAYECYDICFDAWTGYINNSLRDLIETGKGQPNPYIEPQLADKV